MSPSVLAALHRLCVDGPQPKPKPITIGRRCSRPAAPFTTLVRLGFATLTGEVYEVTPMGKEEWDP